MVAFPEVDEWADGHLELPIRSLAHPAGRTYRVDSPPAAEGVKLQKLYARAIDREVAAAAGRGDAGTAELLDDAQERDLYERSLGPAFHQMVGDGVSWAMVKHAGLTAFYWHVDGLDAALRWWARPLGEAAAPLLTT